MFGGLFGAATSSSGEGEQQVSAVQAMLSARSRFTLNRSQQTSFDIWSLAEKAKASLAEAVNSVQEVAQTIKDTNWNQELSSFTDAVKTDADKIAHTTQAEVSTPMQARASRQESLLSIQ